MTHVEEKWIPTDPVWPHQLQQMPVIAVIRVGEPDLDLGFTMATTALQAGIRFIEIAVAAPEACEIPLDLIEDLRSEYPDHQIGAGTVLTVEQAEQAIQAGAQFVVSPVLDRDILHRCQQQQIPAIPGALTPGEIWGASQAGATAIKVFPVESLGGIAYLHHLRKPLGSLPLIPTGGVTLANTQEFLEAGAMAVGIGADLFPGQWVAEGNWPGIQERIGRFVERLRARSTPEGQGN